MGIQSPSRLDSSLSLWGRLFVKMTTILSFPVCMALQYDFTVAFHQEIESISPSLVSGLACDLLWPTECGGNDTVLSRGLKKTRVLLLSLEPC